MKRTLLSVAMMVSLMVSTAAARQWTSRAGGFAVEAELVDVKDGNAILKKADGSQILVPLNKLSLGDVRYINEVLKAAEAGITGGKAESPAPGKANPPGEPQAGAAKPAGASAAALKKLHYGWKKDQTYVYRVRIIGERGNDTENRTGDVTYKVKSTQLDEIQLAMTSNMRYAASATPGRYVLLPGRHIGFISNADGAREATVRIDPYGRLLESKGEAPLPYLLGDLSELVVERLPQIEQSTWTIEGDPGVAVVSLQYPFWRFSMAGFREGVPAAERTVYTVLEASDSLITISKHYEMSSAAALAGKPRIEAVGDGKLKFDVQRGVFASLDFDIKVTVRDSNKTEETPLHMTYRLLSDQEIAEAAREARQAKEEAEKARREKFRPLTDKEIGTALADLGSDDAERTGQSLKLLAEKRPKEPKPEVARALESIMLTSENGGHRAEAARALQNWGDPKSVSALIKVVTSDQWAPVRSNAIDALCKSMPKEAIKPVALQLGEHFTRGAAAKFLKAAGPEAEDVVLPYLQQKDGWIVSTACGILEVIGTKKSLPALEKAVADDNWMINGAARKAVAAIKARMQIDAAK